MRGRGGENSRDRQAGQGRFPSGQCVRAIHKLWTSLCDDERGVCPKTFSSSFRSVSLPSFASPREKTQRRECPQRPCRSAPFCGYCCLPRVSSIKAVSRLTSSSRNRVNR